MKTRNESSIISSKDRILTRLPGRYGICLSGGQEYTARLLATFAVKNIMPNFQFEAIAHFRYRAIAFNFFDLEERQTFIEIRIFLMFSTSKRSYQSRNVRPLRGRKGLRRFFLSTYDLFEVAPI